MNRHAMWGLAICIQLLTAGRCAEADPQPAGRPVSTPAVMDVKTKKPNDQVKVRLEDETATLDVFSPSGIGSATVTLTKGKWPRTVILRLHLKGLESFAVSSGKVKLAGSVLSHSGNTKRLYLTTERQDGQREPLTEIKVLSAEGKPVEGLPGQGGYFEITLPKVLLEDESKSLELGWIDFFRG